MKQNRSHQCVTNLKKFPLLEENSKIIQKYFLNHDRIDPKYQPIEVTSQDKKYVKPRSHWKVEQDQIDIQTSTNQGQLLNSSRLGTKIPSPNNREYTYPQINIYT